MSLFQFRFTWVYCLIFLGLGHISFGQCMQLPVSLDFRIDHAQRIALIHLEDKIPYMLPNGNIYTLNVATVKCWLKNPGGDTKISIITDGGVVGDRAQVTYPSLEMDGFHDYLLFLDVDNQMLDNKNMRVAMPGIQQCLPFCSSQGSLTYEFGQYFDLYSEAPRTEKDLFQYIETRTGIKAKTPEGADYTLRSYTPQVLSDRAMPITTFTPNPTNAGTIAATDFLTITGSGFGAVRGNVFFSNANDGGMTLVGSGVNSDYIFWSDGSIQVKPMGRAGTGPIQVNSIVSPTNLTVNYSHIDINSDFHLFTETTRQRYYLRNKNGAGGYTFRFNDNFNANVAARASFNRGLANWRCATLINWISSETTTPINIATADGVNVVTFVTTLPFPVVGLATSRFSGSGSTPCQQQNTVWWLDEIDVEFADPSLTNWNFGPGAPGGGQIDFETVATHELGHAHGLGHRIAPGQTMHYQIITGTQARTPAMQEANGGIAKMAYSTVPTCFNPGGSGTPIIPVTLVDCALVPLRWISLHGTYVQNGHELTWKVASETQIEKYLIERSSDGINFSPIAEVEFRDVNGAENEYSYTDLQPLNGVNYYRIRQNDLDGHFSYSQMITMKKGNEAVVYPVPTREKIKLQGFTGRNLTLRNMQGQTMREWVISEGESNISLIGLPAGLYYLHAAESGEVWKVIFQP